jgi:hypothetical protein
MATIDDKKVIDGLIKQLKKNPDHTDSGFGFQQVSQYTTPEGKVTYSVSYDQRDVDLLYESPFCRDIKVLWRKRA